MSSYIYLRFKCTLITDLTCHVLSCRAPDTPSWKKQTSWRWQWSTWGTCSAYRWTVNTFNPRSQKDSEVTSKVTKESQSHKYVINIRLLSFPQQRSLQMPASWANTEPDSTSAWTRSLASSPPQRESTRRWGRGSSTTCPAAWARWCPWTTPSRPPLSRHTWPSLSMCSFHPLCPSAALPWAPSSVLPKPSPPRSLVASSSCLQPMDSLLFWSLTRPLPPPQPLSSPFMRTRECLLRLTPVRCTAAQHRLQHLQSTAWHPSQEDPRRSARWGSAQVQRATSLCGGPGSLED